MLHISASTFERNIEDQPMPELRAGMCPATMLGAQHVNGAAMHEPVHVCKAALSVAGHVQTMLNHNMDHSS